MTGGSKHKPIVMPGRLFAQIIEAVRQRYPEKVFGYLLAEHSVNYPTDLLLFRGNVRNEPDWQSEFHAHGRYFRDHDDAGFVSDPQETWLRQKEIWRRGLSEIAVFHSHLRHPANFSGIDYEMHMARFPSLWHLIVSMRNPQFPQVRAFAVSRLGVRELDLLVTAPEMGA